MTQNYEPVLAEALRLRKLGFCPLWIQPKSKKPVARDWTNAPVPSADELIRTYRKGYNLGVRPGKPSKIGDYYAFVIDLDIRKPEAKLEAIAALKKLIPDTKTMLTAQSGSRGESRHLLGLSTVPARSRKLLKSEGFEMVFDAEKGREVKKHDWEIDLKGTGTQFVVAPSIHPVTGLEYRWVRGPETGLAMGDVLVVDAETISQWTGREETAESEPAADYEYGIDRMGWSRERIKASIFKLPSDYVEDRDYWLRTGMAWHHETLGSAEGFDDWCEWAAQSHKFDPKDSKIVWKSFGKTGDAYKIKTLFRDAGMDEVLEHDYDPESDGMPTGEDFADSDDDDGEDEDGKPEASGKEDEGSKAERVAELRKEKKRWLKYFNKRYGIVMLGRSVAISMTRGKRDVLFLTQTDFRLLHGNKWLKNSKPAQLACDMWLQHTERMEYTDVDFLPGREAPKGVLNTWRGWAVEPDDTKSCEKFLWHVKYIVCRGDLVAYNYFMNWHAHALQFPDDKPGVAIVVNGKKGAGKDTPAEYVKFAIGSAYVKVSGSDQITGRFNNAQREALFLHGEEVYFAGDPRETDRMKHFITSPTVRLEPKGIDSYEARSRTRYYLTSNHDRPVDATLDERRFFALTASDEKIGDRKYFNELYTEMRTGGAEALLHYLLTRDLTGFEVRDVPKTATLSKIKMESLPNDKRWWYELLQEASLPGEFDDLDMQWLKKGVDVECSALRESLDRYLDRQRWGMKTTTKDKFGEFVRELGIKRTRARRGSEFVSIYRIPALGDCRAKFDKMIGGGLVWDEIVYDEQPNSGKSVSDLL